MSNVGYIISGGAPLLKKFKTGTGADNVFPGAPLIASASGVAGVVPMAAGTLADYVGLGLDTSVYTTVQSAAMVEGVVTACISPDIAIRSLMSGGSTAGTLLPVITNTVASSGGTLVTITTGDIVPNSPTMLHGTLICLTGNNAGDRRKVTTVSATSATVLVPFRYAIAVGDTFTLVPYFPGAGSALGGDDLTLTTTPGTLVTEADASVASTTVAVRFAHTDIQYDINDPSNGRGTGYIYSCPVRQMLKQLA